MRTLRPLLHLLALLFALGQGFVPAAAAVADGALVAADRGDPDAVHIEQLSGSGCQLVHTDECSLCRLLSIYGPVVHAAPVLPAVPVRVGIAPARVAPLGASADAPFALPRGPPAA